MASSLFYFLKDVALVSACCLTIFISLMVTGFTGHWKRFFVCLFAPMGTIIRYQLSKKFNTSWFPRGTLIANLIVRFSRIIS